MFAPGLDGSSFGPFLAPARIASKAWTAPELLAPGSLKLRLTWSKTSPTRTVRAFFAAGTAILQSTVPTMCS